jgi:splicing factor 3B subunit 3
MQPTRPLTSLLTDLSARFLGSRAVRLVRVQIQKNTALFALSSRPWLNYTHHTLLHFTPLICDNLDFAWEFSAELCPEGLIGIAGNTLRFVEWSSLPFFCDETMGSYAYGL